ncbi:hypothetical protein AHAT_38050 [Agarivorans sp. Toyoura001]|uniref:rhombosortase n=1 Tax=Agarivorans sp. Toyoura001 TaxID=2283141 RepID=UPI0010EE2366|nr:rhombosortase [Agarivorans sp. Toyoura001]GDY27915.1 hypothetical protein AHAT_38050 [Agarivorans sp. Toyoura001]
MFNYLLKQFWFIWLTLALSWVLLAHTELASWNKHLIIEGEYWRVLSGNFCHNNLIHWLMNIATLTLIYFVYDDRLSNRHFLALSILLGLVGGLALLLAKYDEYVGLSGIIHGLLAYAALIDLMKGKIKLGFIVLTGLGIKLVIEQIYGGDPWVTEMIGIDVATDAHLIFTLLGLTIALVVWCPLWNRQPLSS